MKSMNVKSVIGRSDMRLDDILIYVHEEQEEEE